MRKGLSAVAGSVLSAALALGGSDAAAQVRGPTTGAAPAEGGVTLQLTMPFDGAACGIAYQSSWKLSLDQVVRFAETQLSACDIALTLATIEGHVASVGSQIAQAHAENWNAWMAAAAFLPGPDDQAADDRRLRVRDAQNRIQSARNGLRFLAKLAAVVQYPPAPDTQAIAAVPLAPPATTAPSSSSSSPLDALAQPPAAAPITRIACVTGTAWVIEPRPAQNRPRVAIDDPVAGQALAWLSTAAVQGAAQTGFHAFAACPGATPSPSSGSLPPPGAAQGLSPAAPAAPPAPAAAPQFSPPDSQQD